MNTPVLREVSAGFDAAAWDAAWDCEYAGGLSNHLPMALHALQRLGAGDARLRAFATGYVARLRPAPPAQEWPAGDAWPSRLGQRAAWPAYRQLFAQWLDYEEADVVLAQLLPRLMPGCGGAAFHGLIRTAYAVQAGRRAELADALAYWACRWLDLGGEAGAGAATGREADPARVLRALPLPPPGEGLISERMQAAARQDGFDAAVARLRITPATLPKLAQGAATLYAASGNFTLLHLLTSAHALRVLLPFAEAPLDAVAAWWRAWAAAWAASGARDRGLAPLQPWPAIVAQALASSDEHVVKLVDSCRELERVDGGNVWRQAASRVLLAG